MRAIELLAPAKNLECGIAAIDHGADAVYIGAARFGARVAAGNSLDDIASLCDYAHRFRAKVYVTVNTLLRPDEHDEVRQLLRSLADIHVDAILVQDMAVRRMAAEWLAQGVAMPALHASTQTDNRDVGRVRELAEMGFSRVVLARELSLEEIRDIHQQMPQVELEAFVHGALCVSYSGACYASEYCFGRSANRGECAQFCRLKFDLIDADGRSWGERYWLSLKDMCRIEHLEELMDAGVVSLKIEGRLKDADYVKNVVAAYSQRLDDIIRRRRTDYCRSSLGRCTYTFTPDVRKTFNRGYTTYFLHGRTPDIASPDTPKAIGEFVGRVKEIRGNSFNVAGTAQFANGDGLCFFDRVGGQMELVGFRINRVENNRLFPYRMPKDLRPGTSLYRNADQTFSAMLTHQTATRKIPVSMSLSATDEGFSLTMAVDNSTFRAVSVVAFEHQPAQKPQEENIIRQLSKLGDTVFEPGAITVSPQAAQCFIPSSFLSELRRKVVSQIAATIAQSEHQASIDSHQKNILQKNSSHENSHQEKCQETPSNPLMQCRHCIRYSMGYCVRRGGKPAPWREPLTLVMSDGRRFALQFDCHHCQMNVLKVEG